MTLLEQFESYIAQKHLFQKGDRLLLAVSGGLDSVVLSQLCKEAGYDFAIAHCHFGLRGKESDRDAAFVKDWATSLGVDCFIKHFGTTTYAEEKKLSIQVAARKLRYDWFNELLSQENKHWILTAHHRDDNVETVLMNLAKGTGISGLAGIQPKRDKIVRPLLFASRQELLQHATQKGLRWVEDSSNEEDKYTRNAFRHTVIPALEAIYLAASEGIAATIDRMADAKELYNETIARHKKGLVIQKGEEVRIPVLKLQKTTGYRTVLYEIIRHYGFGSGEVEEAIKLLNADTGKWMVSSTHRIIRHRAWLIIAPQQAAEQSVVVIDALGTSVAFQSGELSIKSCNADKAVFADNNTVFIDATEVTFPLVLRPWKAGDYFYPLGMKKKKKLSRFFIDAKLSKTEKESIWVLESDKRIIWIIGHRIDERFKIMPSTKAALSLNFRRTT